MMKYLPNQKSSGYTIIEIIISIFILAIIFSVVAANYRQYILKTSLDAVKSQIVSDIKLAQEYALAGKKPPSCTGLNGYYFRIYSDTNPDLNYYRIYANCGSTDILVKEVYLKSAAKQVLFTGSDTSPYLLFKILGGGTNITEGSSKVYTIKQQTSDTIKTITITSGGEVK